MRSPESIVGNSPALALALEHLSRLAPVPRPVLVVGERGTGKELAAERLHYLSPRWDAPLVKVNCAAMAESLLESELFGHETGAFTGATKAHRGHFEQADGGTLFLDELATMSVRLQEKLLRLIEYGEFKRVGGSKTMQVDVRVIAATNADLPHMAGSGEFRADLLDRLSFDVVHLPPLRHRPGDIEELAEHFAIQMCAELGRDLFPGFSATALQALRAHPWPGNVRELKNTVERSIFRWQQADVPVDEIILDPFRSPYADSEVPTRTTTTPEDGPEPAGAERESTKGFQQQIQELKTKLLRGALAANGNNQRRAAEALDLTYDQIRGLVRKHKGLIEQH